MLLNYGEYKGLVALAVLLKKNNGKRVFKFGHETLQIFYCFDVFVIDELGLNIT